MELTDSQTVDMIATFTIIFGFMAIISIVFLFSALRLIDKKETDKITKKINDL